MGSEASDPRVVRRPGAGASADGPADRRQSRRRSDARRSGGGRGSLRPRRIGSLSVLLPPQRGPAQSLASCLETLRQEWQQQGHEAALWLDWPALAGPQLAPHCRPLRLQQGVLWIGATPGPWLQALQYNRHQLLGAVRAAGYSVRELRIQQHHPERPAAAASADAAASWACHPSRLDRHGLGSCPQCARPAPGGELARWGHCSFCRRTALALEGPPPYPEPPEEG